MTRTSLSSPDWIEALKARRPTRLVRAWGVGGVRVAGDSRVSVRWRDRQTFVLVERQSKERCAVQEVDVDEGTVDRWVIEVPMRQPEGNDAESMARWVLEMSMNQQDDSVLADNGLWFVSLAGGVDVHDVERRRLLSTGAPGFRGRARDGLLAASADGRRVAFGGEPSGRYWPTRVLVRDVEGGTDTFMGSGEVHRIRFAFTEDGRELLASEWGHWSSPDRLLRYDAGTGAVLGTVVAPVKGSVMHIEACGPGHARVLIETAGLYDWDLEADRLDLVHATSRPDRLLVAAREAASVVAEVFDDGVVRWHERGAMVDERRTGLSRPTAWVSPDCDATLLRGSGDCEFLCVARSDRKVPSGFGERSATHRGIALSRDGRWLAVGERETIRVLDVDSGEAVWLLEGFRSEARGLCFHPSRRELYSVHEDELRRWDLGAGKETGRVPMPNRVHIHSARPQMSPDGTRIAFSVNVASADDPSNADNPTNGNRVAVADVEPFGRLDTSVVQRGDYDFAPNGDLLLIERTDDSTIETLRRIAPGGRSVIVGTRERREGEDWYSTFSGDGALLASLTPAEADGRSEPRLHRAIVDTATMETRAIVGPIPWRVWPHVGRRFLTGVEDARRLLLFDAATGKPVDEIDLTAAMAPHATFLVDEADRRVVVALDTGAILVFETG